MHSFFFGSHQSACTSKLLNFCSASKTNLRLSDPPGFWDQVRRRLFEASRGCEWESFVLHVPIPCEFKLQWMTGRAWPPTACNKDVPLHVVVFRRIPLRRLGSVPLNMCHVWHLLKHIEKLLVRWRVIWMQFGEASSRFFTVLPAGRLFARTIISLAHPHLAHCVIEDALRHHTAPLRAAHVGEALGGAGREGCRMLGLIHT